MAAARTLWTALVGLYEETLVLVGGNLAAVALNVPIGLILVLIAVPLGFAWDGQQLNSLFLLGLGAMGVFLPTPGNLALAGLTQVAAGPDVPRFGTFRATLASRWRLALRASLVSVVVMAMLAWNVTFYATRFWPDWPAYISVIWLYALVFWLGLHLYLVPLAVHVAEPRLVDLYKRAAFIALGHAGYTLLLLVPLLVVSVAAVAFLPVYLLVAPAYVSLAQAHALREIRRRHGDLPAEPDEEVGRL